MKYRIKKGELICELFVPKSNDLKKAIIVIPGLPNQPRNEIFGENLASKGYYVLQPRYIGSWESYGKFSISGCIRTVSEAEKIIDEGQAIECRNNKKIVWDVDEKIFLSSSFGSSVVLSQAHQLNTRKLVCLCPLVDLSTHNRNGYKEQDLESLGHFLKSGFENAFRGFDPIEWKEFSNGNSEANPCKYVGKIRGKKIFLVHGKRDLAVDYRKTLDFANRINEENDVQLKIYEDVGHGKEIKKMSLNIVDSWIREF